VSDVSRMNVLERWLVVCPVHGDSGEVRMTGENRGCWFWSTDDVKCREEVEMVRLTSDQGAVDQLANDLAGEAIATLRDIAAMDPADGHAQKWAAEDALRKFGGQRAEKAEAEARLYAEKMRRDRDDVVRRCGADILQILDGTA
jgi:hypothetical protein